MLVTLFALTSIQAQNNVVKVDLLGVLLENTQLSYERIVNENSAFEISLKYQKIKGSLATLSNETEVNAIGVEGKYKFYVSSFWAGLVGGHQWILGAFSIDINLGGIYKSVGISGDIVSIELDGLLPKFGLGLGFTF